MMVPIMKNLAFRLLFLAAAIIFLLPAACGKMPEGNPEYGERWFRMNRCNGCHGEKGVGGKGIGEQGPAIAGLRLSYRQFISQLRDPQSAIMPVFGPERVSEQDAADIYLWLKSLEK